MGIMEKKMETTMEITIQFSGFRDGIWLWVY